MKLVALEREFGWSRAVISGAYTPFTIVNAVAAPAVGWLLRRVDSGSGIGVFLGLPALHALFMRYAPPGFAEAVAAPHGSGKARRAPPAGVTSIGVAFLLGPVAFHSLMTQQVALFQDQGVTAAVAVWIASATGLCVFAFRFAAGVFDLTGSYAAALVLIIAAVGGQYVSYRTALRRA